MRFDIIIDDGDHENVGIVNTFENLFLAHLRPGGSYFVEDSPSIQAPDEDGGLVMRLSKLGVWSYPLAAWIESYSVKLTYAIDHSLVLVKKRYAY